MSISYAKVIWQNKSFFNFHSKKSMRAYVPHALFVELIQSCFFLNSGIPQKLLHNAFKCPIFIQLTIKKRIKTIYQPHFFNGLEKNLGIRMLVSNYTFSFSPHLRYSKIICFNFSCSC